MLFSQDLFDLTWGRGDGTRRDDGETTSAIEMALELAEASEWIASLDIVRDYALSALAARVPSPPQQKVLAVAALCESHVARITRAWGLAAD
jgi:hypothetical protein